MEEKCYIGGIQRFSTEDGPGIRTTIFLKGCPLSCKWCHNPELIDFDYAILFQKKKCIRCGVCIEECPTKAISVSEGNIIIRREQCSHCGSCIKACCSGALHSSSIIMTPDELMESIRRDRDFYNSSGGGITLSGGEILSHGEYAIQIAERASGEGISVVTETSGFGDFAKLRRLAELSEQVLFDLKHMDQEKHKHYVGVTTGIIHRNLRKLVRVRGMKSKVILRIPLLHGINDDLKNLEEVCSLMLKTGLTQVHLLPYHSMGISKAREMGLIQEKYETPSEEHLQTAADIFRTHDIQVRIMGE